MAIGLRLNRWAYTPPTSVPAPAFFASFFNPADIDSETKLLDSGGQGNDLLLVNRNCLVGDGTAALTFSNLPTYDAIIAVINGTETAISLSLAAYVMVNSSKYNYIIFKNTGSEVAKFPLMEGSGANCFDVLGSGASCEITDFADNWGKADGRSWNYKHGFALVPGSDILYPKNESGNGYGGITTETIVEKQPMDINADWELKADAAAGYAEALADLDTDEVFFVAGVPVAVNPADFINSDYINVEYTDTVITTLEIG